MNIKDLIKNYLLYIERQHSLGTFKFYVSHLNHFSRFCANNNIKCVNDLNNQVINDYISLNKEKCENTTINKRIGILKRMFKKMNIDHPYLQSIEKLKERSKTFDMLSRKQLKAINAYSYSLPDNINNNLMYKGIINLLTDTGARISEILAIQKKNISLEENYGYILLTKTKTKEDRFVPFSINSIETVKKLLANNPESPYLFYNKLKKRPTNYDDVNYFIKILKDKLDIDKLHPHMFRHSMATIWLENGADLKSVMLVLGHKNMKTTDRYLHNSITHITKTYVSKFRI